MRQVGHENPVGARHDLQPREWAGQRFQDAHGVIRADEFERHDLRYEPDGDRLAEFLSHADRAGRGRSLRGQHLRNGPFLHQYQILALEDCFEHVAELAHGNWRRRRVCDPFERDVFGDEHVDAEHGADAPQHVPDIGVHIVQSEIILGQKRRSRSRPARGREDRHDGGAPGHEVE